MNENNKKNWRKEIFRIFFLSKRKKMIKGRKMRLWDEFFRLALGCIGLKSYKKKKYKIRGGITKDNVE